MNPWQMAQQIKHELQQITWPDGTGGKVFGNLKQSSVVVFAGVPTEQQLPTGYPWALVGIGNGEADEDHPELIEQQFEIVCGAQVGGDPMGEFALIGGSQSDLGKSAGRGILEVAERVRSAVQNLTGVDGAPVQITTSSTGSPTVVGRGKHLALDELVLTAVCTSALHYSAPQEASVSGSTLSWNGAHCEARFDFYQYRVFEEAGTEPSADPVSNGTLCYTGTATEKTGINTGKALTVVADYNARGKLSAAGTSGVEVGAWAAS